MPCRVASSLRPVDDLHAFGPEDPDWDRVPQELRETDGQPVRVRGVQWLPESITPEGLADRVVEIHAQMEVLVGPP
jgi:hypothetical protein